jgi:hypothetical protein
MCARSITSSVVRSFEPCLVLNGLDWLEKIRICAIRLLYSELNYQVTYLFSILIIGVEMRRKMREGLV